MIPWLLASLLTAPPSRVEVVWDGVAAADEAQVSHALASEVRASGRAAGITRRSYFLHPLDADPAIARWTVSLPRLEAGQRLILSTWAGLSDGVKPEEGTMDGVGLSLVVAGRRLHRVLVTKPEWVPVAVDLAPYAGQTVTVELVSDDGGGKGNCSYDWANFGEPQILRLTGNSAVDGRTETLAGVVLAEHDGAPAGSTLTLRPLDAGGRPVAGGELTVPLSAVGKTLLDFDLYRTRGARSVDLETVPGATLTVAAHAPVIDLVSLGPSRGVIFAGQSVEGRVVLRNSGRGALLPEHGLTAQFAGDFEGRRTLASLAPGAEATLSATAGRLSAGEARLAVGLSYTVAGWPAAIDDERTFDVQPARLDLGSQPVRGVKIGARPSGRWGAHTLANSRLRVIFWGSGQGPIELQTVVGGRYKTVATAPRPVEAVLAGGGEVSEWTVSSPAPGALRFAGPMPVAGPARFVPLAVTYSLAADSNAVEVACELGPVPAGGFAVSALRGPSLLVGDGTTGRAKRQALFPGLEYLRADDTSSSTRDFDPPLHLRLVPDPYKITVPVMAVETADATVALTWDPLQTWHGERALPRALFAVPNFVDGQDNHRLQLFVPGGPELVAENEQTAREPFGVAAGETVKLRQRILALPGRSVLDAVDVWTRQVGGLPAPQPMPRDDAAQRALSRHGFLETVWDDQTKKSQHCVGWADANAPQFASLLLFDHLLTGSPEALERARLIVDTTVAEEGPGGLNSPACCHILRHNTPFYFGRLDDCLPGMRQHAAGCAGSMSPEGAWGFQRPAENAMLGEEGAIELGLCALNAMHIWRWIRFSGDAELLDEGRTALGYMERFVVPAGAQGWECPIHQPDILAAAYAIRAYVDAYRVTGHKPYLDRAVYWARTGLPFLYLWDDPAKPGMRYASIPVFGSTFRTHSWLGLPVQWCGLVYAYGLQQLAAVDDSYPWARVAEGVGVSACWQQCNDDDPPELKGSYPDSWGQYFTRKNGAYINPEDIEVVMLAARGHDVEPRTAIVNVGGDRLHITSGALVRSARVDRGTVILSLERPAGATTFTMVPFCAKPGGITIAGRAATLGDDLDAAGVDARYDARQAALFFRVTHGDGPVEVRLGGLRRALPPQPAVKRVWRFDADAEGFGSANACEVTAADGALRCRVTGFDAYFSAQNAWFPARDFPRLVVRARMSAPGELGLFWGTTAQGGTAAGRSLAVPLPGDGQWHDLVFDLRGRADWRGTVNLLRFDPEPADLPAGTTLEIDWVEARAGG